MEYKDPRLSEKKKHSVSTHSRNLTNDISFIALLFTSHRLIPPKIRPSPAISPLQNHDIFFQFIYQKRSMTPWISKLSIWHSFYGGYGHMQRFNRYPVQSPHLPRPFPHIDNLRLEIVTV